MITLIAYYRLWLVAAFLIGLATAWWTWGRASRLEDARGKDQSSIFASNAAKKEPVPQPQDQTAPDSEGDAIESAPAQADGDDLTQIKGIDAPMASMLNLLGIRQYGEIASWTDMEAEQMTVLLGAGPGRIVEDRWVEQARLLASGDRAEFEERFGHL